MSDRGQRTDWTRVEDGLPDDDVEVLVFCSEVDDVFLGYYSSDDGRCRDADQFFILGVTHWKAFSRPEVSQ